MTSPAEAAAELRTTSAIRERSVALLERARRDPEIKAGMFPLMGKWNEIMIDLLRRGVESGDLRPDLDPVPGAQMLIGAMIGFSRSPAATVEEFKPMRAELLRAIRNPFKDAK